MILDSKDSDYIKKWNALSASGKNNGAYYYSLEIARNIIPNVETERNWVLLNVKGKCWDNSIVFIHNNLRPENYEWLSDYKDLVLVCGVGETCEKVSHLGKAIYLPLSVDVEEVAQYKTEKTKDTAFAGRRAKREGIALPNGIDYISAIPREDFLKKLAQYRNVYAVGRTAIEAKILGCKVLPYDDRYPNPRRWRVVDNLEAAKLLQEKLDKIDGGRK